MKNEVPADGLVINLHFTDVCNYHCKFCFARFGVTPLSLKDWKEIVNNIVRDTHVKRFNLAGGEPLAAPFVQELIDHIHSVGVDCSLITNGSLLTPQFIERNAGKLSMIGISVDGITHEENLQLGRANAAGKTLSNERLAALAGTIHQVGMKLKINTVVNALNHNDDFSALIGTLKPDRWKILRMIQIEAINDQTNLTVSNGEFERFVARHEAFSPVVEDTEDIIHAYVVINPYGQLVDNSDGQYRMSKSLIFSSFSTEFAKVGMDLARYQKRYQAAA